MSAVVSFSRVHEWALLPKKHQIARAAERETTAMYRTHFRYQRRVRTATSCPPWVLGQELGWIVASPIDVTLTTVEDVQFDVDEQSDAVNVGRMLNRPDLWHRDTGWLATNRTDWLRFTQFKGAQGEWEAMFLPNGEGSVEWRLGWAAHIPDDTFLMFTGLDTSEGFEIPTGIMTAKQVNRTAETGGMSMAIRPRRTLTLARGAPLARMVLLHRQSIQATSEEIG